MLLWFVGTAVAAIWYVFRDPRFDYRLVIVGALLPPVVDAWSGGAWVMHSLTASVVLLAVVMLATIGRRPLRRTLLGLPLGTFVHLVFTGAWTLTAVFWWPFSGLSFDDTPLPVVSRGWWNLPLEVIGAVLVVYIYRSARLAEPAARRRFLATGQLWFGAASAPDGR